MLASITWWVHWFVSLWQSKLNDHKFKWKVSFISWQICLWQGIRRTLQRVWKSMEQIYYMKRSITWKDLFCKRFFSFYKSLHSLEKHLAQLLCNCFAASTSERTQPCSSTIVLVSFGYLRSGTRLYILSLEALESSSFILYLSDLIFHTLNFEWFYFKHPVL